MTISKLSTLVSTTWLRQQLSGRSATAASNSLRILDTSWMPEKEIDGYRDYYCQGHIPSSLHFDIRKCHPPTSDTGVLFPIPDTNVFKDYVEDLGISSDTHVIAYDRLNGRPTFRTWFLFRLFGHNQVSVLSGGLNKWVAEGNHVTTEEISVPKGNFTPKFRPELLHDYEAMVKTVKTGSEQVVDARPDDLFEDGHILGSKRVLFDSVFNKDGTFKDVTQLQKLFDEGGVDLNSPIISTCRAGLTACAIIAAAHMLGKEDVPLYNGSFSEWNKIASPDLIGRGPASS